MTFNALLNPYEFLFPTYVSVVQFVFDLFESFRYVKDFDRISQLLYMFFFIIKCHWHFVSVALNNRYIKLMNCPH